MDFYSTRQERLSKSSSEVKKAYEKRDGKGIFKKNPHLRMMLIDLCIILLFALIIVPIFVRLNNSIRIYDFDLTTKTFIFEEKILITIKIEKSKRKSDKAEQFGELNITINNELNGKDNKKSILLSKDTKKEYINFTLPYSNDTENIIINLSLNDYVKEYIIKIDKQ
jgi:hypothetical protein